MSSQGESKRLIRLPRLGINLFRRNPIPPPDIKSLMIHWDTSNLSSALQQLHEWVVAKTRDNIFWYTRNAKARRTVAQRARITALALLGLGAIAPVLIDLLKLVSNIAIPPTVATLIIAAGTGLIGLDRLMGYSTGWMRYITTEMLLTAKLEQFEYEWLEERATWSDPPTPDQAQQAIRRGLTFRNEVLTTVQNETQLWVEEFQANLSALDDSFRQLGQANRSGALAIAVNNAEAYADGWELRIDDRVVDHFNGTMGAATNVTPGLHKVTVTGLDKTKKIVHPESVPAEIKPGETTRLEITLPAKPASGASKPGGAPSQP